MIASISQKNDITLPHTQINIRINKMIMIIRQIKKYNQYYVEQIQFQHSMSKSNKSFFALTFANQQPFKPLESKLIVKNTQQLISETVEEMEKIFIQNNVLNQLLSEEKSKAKVAKENINIQKKRLSQISYLNSLVCKQTSMMKTRTEKINDALTLNKILMMEKVIRLQRQAQDLKRKRSLCQKIRTQKQVKHQNKKYYTSQKRQRVRLQSLNTTVALKNQLQNVRCQTMDMKRKQAEQIRLEHERQKTRSRKIQSYKKQRARNNYLSKIQDLQREIEEKQSNLYQVVLKQDFEQIRAEVTNKVADQYLYSFFPTQGTTIS